MLRKVISFGAIVVGMIEFFGHAAFGRFAELLGLQVAPLVTFVSVQSYGWGALSQYAGFFLRTLVIIGVPAYYRFAAETTEGGTSAIKRRSR